MQVADSFLAGLEGAAQSCITSLPSLNGAPEATAVTDQLNKCCPVIKKVRAASGTFSLFLPMYQCCRIIKKVCAAYFVLVYICSRMCQGIGQSTGSLDIFF